MTQENDSFSDDLAQIVRHQQSNLQLLEDLKMLAPHLAEDFSQMQQAAAANVADLEAIAEREKAKAENQ